MNKIKVITLLNMIANGEEVPEKIKFEGVVFTLEKETYYRTNTLYSLIDYIKLKRSTLNDEVEIIEEEPEIDIQGIEDLPDYDMGIEVNKNKINELIKAVKQLDNQINGDKQSIKRR